MIICANLWTKKLSGKESRELAQASRNHEVPWLYPCGAKSRDFEKAVDFRAKKRMKSVDKESDHRGGIDHRLTQICTD